MANHLTPEELSKEVGIDRAEVIRICIEEHVPIYQGKIDKTLFQAQLRRSGRSRRSTSLRRERATSAGGALASARRRLLRGRRSAPLRGRDGRAQRLHQVDDRRASASAAGCDELAAVELRLEQLAQRRAVLARQLRRVESALEPEMICRASASSSFFTRRPATGSSISSWLFTSSARNSVSSASAWPRDQASRSRRCSSAQDVKSQSEIDEAVGGRPSAARSSRSRAPRSVAGLEGPFEAGRSSGASTARRCEGCSRRSSRAKAAVAPEPVQAEAPTVDLMEALRALRGGRQDGARQPARAPKKPATSSGRNAPPAASKPLAAA